MTRDEGLATAISAKADTKRGDEWGHPAPGDETFTPEQYSAAFWPGFAMTCSKCGGGRVRLDNTIGHSPTSGLWGSLDIVCDDCGATCELWGPA